MHAPELECIEGDGKARKKPKGSNQPKVNTSKAGAAIKPTISL
jgi:hypothetical protein